MPPKKKTEKTVNKDSKEHLKDDSNKYSKKGQPQEEEQQDSHKNGSEDQEQHETHTKSESKPTSTDQSKRKANESSTSSEPNKAPRRGRSTAKASNATHAQILSYLLSSASHSLCHPNDTADDSKTKTYSGTVPLSPFEEVMCSLILSRPISHNLGYRSIRTLLNSPYSFNSPQAIVDAGEEKVHQSLEEARTQHKAKTAQQLYQLANTAVDQFCQAGKSDDAGLERLRSVAQKEGVAEMRDTLTREVKGLGGTGVDIFVRRVQGVWDECYPFVDARTKASVEKLGLPGDASKMQELIADLGEELKLPSDASKASDQHKQRLAFVTILERAVGADLEGNSDDVLKAAESL